jgi:hypothetical protein
MSSKKSMEEVSVAELIGKYNMIVPEIQREYVWGLNKNDILNTFINDIKGGVAQSNSKRESSKASLDILKGLYDAAEDDSARRTIDKLVQELGTNLASMNIGFLYSYKPDYYVFNDRNEDVYLIDGQQRFTTLFLMLFYFSIKEGRRDEFVELFRFNADIEQIAFDYRVRTLTHNFFIDLISNTKTLADLDQITSKNWFLSNYEHDVTIKSMVGDSSIATANGLFPVLHLNFRSDANNYFDYLKKQIKFWHFKTEETSQGEELYITMNSRGQQLADNETIRARLFEPEEITKTGNTEIYWSEQWENWQDFFWKKRDKGIKGESSADVGFNEFLRWVQIIRMTERQTQIIDDDDENAPDKKEIAQVIKWEKNKKINISFLTLNDIQEYFNALLYLYNDFDEEFVDAKSHYKVYKKFDLIEAKWLCPVDGAITQLDCFKFLPILYYCKIRLQSNEKIEPLTLFRLIRFLYNLSKNETISKTASVQCIHALKMVDSLKGKDDVTDLLSKKGISVSILNGEEKLKLSILNKSESRIQTEDWFWEAEEIDVNEGEISHLIELTKQINSGTNDFDLSIFINVVVAYLQLLAEEDKLWGDLFNSNVYDDSNHRAVFYRDYHKRSGFLALTRKWYESIDKNLDVFLTRKRKDFVKNYASSEEIVAEPSIKKQLYIYYILQKTIIKNAPVWDWNNGYNFGGFENKEGARPIFKDGLIFQQYNAAWRENESKILWIQKNLKNKTKNIEELLTWSKT